MSVDKIFKKGLIICVAFLGSCRPADKSKLPVENKQLNVSILMYPGIDLLNFAGPLEVFNSVPDFNVFTVSPDQGKVFTSKGLVILPDYNFSNAPKADILVLPGAPLSEIKELIEKTSTIEWIRRQDAVSTLTMSVSTGTLLLSEARLIDGKKVTTHISAMKMLKLSSPKALIVSGVKFVKDGKILSTSGITSGIDGALHAVGIFKGVRTANSLASLFDYGQLDSTNGSNTGLDEEAFLKSQ